MNPLAGIATIAQLVAEHLDEGRNIILFAPTGAGALMIAEVLADAAEEIRTPDRMGFLGEPDAPRETTVNGLLRFSVRRDLLGAFLLEVERQKLEAPFLCVVQAAGPMPTQGDFDSLVAAGLSPTRRGHQEPLCDPNGQIEERGAPAAVWPEHTPNATVLALEPGPTGPTLAWTRRIF